MTTTTTIPAVTIPASAPPRNVAINYLRAFITLLVVEHHAILAYYPMAPVPQFTLTTQRWWEAFPVVDSQHWTGFAFLIGFNDMFFMALMFFLSGLFAWKSLQRKGSGRFVVDRALRLGLPFVVAAGVVAPLAYYPSYLQTGGSGVAGFWQQWKSLGNWPAGPAWFVWVLLAFDLIAAGLLLLMPRWGEMLGNISARMGRRPIVFFGLLVALSAAAYTPLAIIFNPLSWANFGPFFFQTSRALHYFVYFLVGVGVGAYGLDRGLLAGDGKLARRWPIWLVAAPVVFIVAGGISFTAVTAHLGSRGWELAGDFAFLLSCATSSFAFLALFVRFAKTHNRVWDSLSANAYGMYLIHYAFVSWLQYALLKAALPGVAKGALVFLAAVLLSWGTTAALRRIPAVARVI
jgi:hypothetical protein